MANTVYVELALGDLSVLRLELPLKPDASILTGLDIKVRGKDEVGNADTEYTWCPSIPIVVPKEA